ncbi:EAL domain, c-di-GMP-specific phosphodiesterase class I (or its enzymatically inactive variant) [Pseudobutyrivibrio sp. C4]|uniref:EAL domain-containing protein n=1 Tax=Pseudobutyrivibrio sp. C4 TaxID=1520803 RepID=UPI0008BD779A|nr:EAL domain-containing protein [Pseudobutyrivibrio sp. C4]SET43575.1 EAL domain, c-di-GMP-specific phosphodiesterase class I (or its enzymatically inactive variant) [Pseudobutyrivibrio sp. C4]
MSTSFLDKVVNAIENREIKAYYQPQYDASTGRIVSAEALVRWVKPNGEIISPDKFIPRLEKTDDINILDWYMAEEACRTIHEMGDKAVPIAVNFSRWHVKEKDFYRKLQAILTTYKVKPEMFEVEITESALAVEDLKSIEEWATNIADTGVKIAIDDFGAGFTSLQFVKNMPVSFLKVDKAFLEDNCQDERGRGTLETVFFFARRLSLKTIAEGVETMEQLKFLQNMDCDRVQGYLFSRPLKKEDFLVLAMIDNAPMVDDDDFLKKQGTFSTHSLLLRAMKTEYDMIMFGNLYKNSYYMMYQNPEIFFDAPTAGVIDDMTHNALAICVGESYKVYEENLTRPALLKAYNKGKTRVEVVVEHNVAGVPQKFRTIIHLMKHPHKEDVLMIGFSRKVEE